MSKQRERERIRVKKKQQGSRQLMVGGIVLVLIAAVWFLFMNRGTENSNIRAISRLTTTDFHSLAFSLTEPETVFFGHHGGLLVSANGGRDWESTSLTNADAMALALPASNPQVMYAAGHDVFFKSTDGGATWESVGTNLPGTDMHGFTVDPENADHVFAHVVGFGVFDSEDGGSTWTLLSDAVPSSTFNLAVGEDSQTLYAAAGEAGLLQSVDGGQTWSSLPEGPDAGALAVTYVRADGRVYVTTLGPVAGLYFSEDDGLTWTFAGLKEIILAIAVSPLDPNHLIVVNNAGEVFASRDGGISWLDE
jgi:photosystem II stability/assembly factor-like uncharacterized protein